LEHSLNMSTLKTDTITTVDGTGNITFSRPIVADGSNLTSLPAADTSLSNLSSTGENKVAQVWCNFNGTGTIALRDHFNVSSLTDHGTGDYTVSFDSDFASVNYSAVGHSFGTGSANWANVVRPSQQSTTIAVGSLRLETGYSNGSTQVDITHIHIIIFGD
jgi:hypothetical protein